MMVEEFLFDILFDMYEAYLECQGMSQNEYDSMFFDENGYEIEEKEYLLEHRSDVLCDEVIDAVYTLIIEDGLPNEYNFNNFINLLLSRYYLYRYNPDDTVIRYIKKTDIEDIIRLFKENYDFGMDLLRNYYLTLIDKEI